MYVTSARVFSVHAAGGTESLSEHFLVSQEHREFLQVSRDTLCLPHDKLGRSHTESVHDLKKCTIIHFPREIR
jgi:hypothetical protein